MTRLVPSLGRAQPRHLSLLTACLASGSGQLCQGSQRVPQMRSCCDSPPNRRCRRPLSLSGVGGLMWEAWNRSAVRRYNKLHANPPPNLNPNPPLPLSLTPLIFIIALTLTRYNKLHERREDERYCDELPCAVPMAVPARPEAPAADGVEGRRRRLGDTTVVASVLAR